MYNYFVKILVIFACCLCVNRKAHSQTNNCVASVNNVIKSIPFVFEGIVESVELFAGDEHGNKLSKSSAKWQGDIAYFYDNNGKRANGYSLAKIKVCKVYKGKIPLEQQNTISVLTKGGILNSVHLLKSGDDTIISYLKVPLKHDDEETKVFLPSDHFYKKIYFCERLEIIKQSDFVGKTYYSNFNSLIEFVYDFPFEEKQKDGTLKKAEGYVLACNEIIKTERQLKKTLNKIKTLAKKPKNLCLKVSDK